MRVLATIFFFVLAVAAVSGPPEPATPLLEAEELEALEELESLRVLDEQLQDVLIDNRIIDKKLRETLEGIKEDMRIVEISIDGDSIILTLSNDSVFVFSDIEKVPVRKSGKDVLHVGEDMVVEENDIIHGDIVSALGDVTVKGTVDGSIMAFSGDVYVTSTGTVYGSAVALSGKIKIEPGGRIMEGDFEIGPAVHISEFRQNAPFRVMGYVLFIIYIIWMVLAATGASLFKKNVSVVINTVRQKAVSSFFKGYLTYILIVVAFVVFLITILGIPLAVLGIPIAALAGMILSFIAVSNIVGQKILNADEPSFRTFLYGSLAMGLVPGLFFLTLMITGSIVIMVFSWIFVFVLLSIILPFGLGAVLSTRFGVRTQNSSNSPGQSA